MQSLQNEKSKLIEVKKQKIYEDQRDYHDEVVKLKAGYQNRLKTMKEDVFRNKKFLDLFLLLV